MKLATSAQMKELDRRAIEERHIPSIDLMERAAEGVAEAALSLLPGRPGGHHLLQIDMGRAGPVAGADLHGADPLLHAEIQHIGIGHIQRTSLDREFHHNRLHLNRLYGMACPVSTDFCLLAFCENHDSMNFFKNFAYIFQEKHGILSLQRAVPAT